MKATLKTENLRNALIQVHPIKINKQLPALSSTLVEFTDGKATLTSSDLERIIRIELDSNTKEPFSVVLPLKRTETFLHGANGDVVLETGISPKNTNLKRDMGDMSLQTFLPSDFPPTPKAESLVYSTLDAKWFCRMLNIMMESCASDEQRPVLTGILCKDGSMASTDGFRLYALNDTRLSFGLGENKVIIPASTAKLIRRLFSKEETLEIAFEHSVSQFDNKDEIKRVHIKSGRVSLISELIQGNYPEYEKLIPPEYEFKVSFSAPVMSQRLSMIDEKALSSGIVRFQFQESGKSKTHECLLTAGSDENGKYSLVAPVTIEKGKESKIAFNMRYIQAPLMHFSMVTVELNSPSSPGVFRGDIEGLTICVMPMFVQW